MKIEILGKGCSKCSRLEEMTRKAVEELKIEAEITKVTDPQKIVEYGVMMTPALVIEGEVKIYGRLPRQQDIVEWLGYYNRKKSE